METDLKDQLDNSTTLKYAVALRFQLFDANTARAQAEAAMAAREAAAKEAGQVLATKVQRIRLVIVEKHFYLACPRCAFKFADYGGCNALQVSFFFMCVKNTLFSLSPSLCVLVYSHYTVICLVRQMRRRLLRALP